MNNVLKILIPALILSSSCRAESNEKFVHFVAHVGASYAINTFSYGICHKVFNMNKVDSVVASSIFTLLVGATYKLVEANGRVPKDFNRSMSYNIMGTVAGIGSIVVFGF